MCNYVNTKGVEVILAYRLGTVVKYPIISL